jgi:hypothetical protein
MMHNIIVSLLLLISLTTSGATYSGTLPVLFIETNNNEPITSKETYLKGTYYLDPMGCNGVSAIGSAEAPETLQIKGRGNYTWTGFDKKPYRLKLDSKAALLGMNKSKHFALLAHADDNQAFLRNTVGFELSKRIGLDWTPEARPVEVVLNGDYIGLYFLTETIRVDKDRVNIAEQSDNITNTDDDAEAVTGGWLVEIDNYDSDPHIEITEGNGQRIIFTYKTPEVLSEEQKSFLYNEMTAINNAIYNQDKSSTDWETLIDIDQLARFYIVQELLDDCESFHGSCYLTRDKGSDCKWKFGPVWDFGNTYSRGSNKNFIYVNPSFNQTWIGEIAKFPNFQNKVKEIWKEFCENEISTMGDYITSFINEIRQAAEYDKERWSSYGNDNIIERRNKFISYFNNSASWLGDNWDYTPASIEPTPSEFPECDIYFRGTLNNWDTSMKFQDKGNGIYQLNNVTIPSNSEFKVASADWKTVDMGSNGNEIVFNEPYLLNDDTHDNIKISNGVTAAYIIFNYKEKTLLLTDHLDSAVSEIKIDTATDSNVYDLAGRIVATNGKTEGLSKGIYIVNGTKVLVK